MTRPVLFQSITDPAQPGGVEAVLRAVVAHVRDRGIPAVEMRSAAAPGAEFCPLHLRDDPQRRLHLPSLLRLARLLARHRPAVVNVQFVTAEALYFAWLKRAFGYRLVLSFHGSDLRLPDSRSAELLPRLIGAADAVTVVSEELRGHLAAFGGVEAYRVHLVPNGVDSTFWTPGPARAPGEVLIAAGRLEPVKGFDLLVDAFARLARDRPAARLVLAGEGSQRQRLTEQAQAAGIADRVEFAGFLGPEALRARYRDADLFVLPSRSEGFPIALLEAMACGLPFVAARVGGVDEIATPESGLCVPPEDVPALAGALGRMLGAGEDARRAARLRAERFSHRAMLAAYLRLVRPVAGPSASFAAIGAARR